MRRDHVSKPRNPLLADLFYRRGLIERWGRGTQKIIDLCVQAGHPAPEFVEQAGDLVVRFIPKGYVPPHRVEHDLTDRQRRALFLLRDRLPRSLKELHAQLDPPVPLRTLQADLALLRTLKLVEFQGRGRGARWRLALPEELGE